MLFFFDSLKRPRMQVPFKRILHIEKGVDECIQTKNAMMYKIPDVNCTCYSFFPVYIFSVDKILRYSV